MNSPQTIADQAIGLAYIHADEGSMQSSAKVCIDDAFSLYCKSEYGYATKRALKSLGYSVGIFHSDYKLVQEWIDSY